MSDLFVELLKKRNFESDFLRPEYAKSLEKVFLENDLAIVKAAAERLMEAAKKQEKVLIYGDYDADGVTASTVMSEILRLIGVEKFEVMLPDRFLDGYGMSQRCVERAKETGVDLVVTVDCGSNNTAIIKELKEAGIETLVTDHHELQGAVPDAVEVVNFKRPDLEFKDELKQLAGVGVAFLVGYQLVLMGKIAAGQEKWLLDLVLIGTICDSMVLTGLNRSLCFYGMKVLAKTRRLGLRELLRLSEAKKINATAVGFMLGPRINAAGRLKSAELAFRLLNTKSKVEAVALASELEDLNQERQKKQREAAFEIEQRGVGEEKVIVQSGDWHEGILGIVAGRLLEKYERPSLVLTEVEKGILKGSGRSAGEFNLALALKKCKKYLKTGGGHAQACGLLLETKNLDEFRQEINKYYNSLKLLGQEKFFKCQADVEVEDFSKFDVELVRKIEELEPFGEGNQEPIWLMKEAFVLSVRKLGEDEQHLKLNLRDRMGNTMAVVAWYVPNEWLRLKEGERVDVWVKLELNEWRGRCAVEGKIVRLECL